MRTWLDLRVIFNHKLPTLRIKTYKNKQPFPIGTTFTVNALLIVIIVQL